MSTIEKIIFIFPYPPTAWEAEKFGFSYFQKYNLNLQVLDLSNLVCTRSHTQSPLKGSYILKIKSYTELEEYLKQQPKSTMIFDGINAIGGLKWQSRHIFRILKKYQINYSIVEMGALPIWATSQASSFFKKLQKIFHLAKLLAYCKWKLTNKIVYYQWKYLNRYHLPQKIFSGESESLKKYLEKYQLSRKRVTPIHSFDYDRYLDFINREKKPFFPNEKIAVFLDQMLAQHTDFGKNVSFSPVTAEKYYPALNHFFKKIEERYGIKVVVAASPRADLKNYEKLFRNRPVFKNKTLELVAESQFVLMHTSTAVSFAVLCNKPILIMQTQEMLHAIGYANFLKNMAQSLGLNPICIEEEKSLHQVDTVLRDIEINNKKSSCGQYDNYKYKYIMSKDIIDKPSWEIIIEDLIKN